MVLPGRRFQVHVYCIENCSSPNHKAWNSLWLCIRSLEPPVTGPMEGAHCCWLQAQGACPAVLQLRVHPASSSHPASSKLADCCRCTPCCSSPACPRLPKAGCLSHG